MSTLDEDLKEFDEAFKDLDKQLQEMDLTDFDESFKELEQELDNLRLSEDDERRLDEMARALEELEIPELDDPAFDVDLSNLYIED